MPIYGRIAETAAVVAVSGMRGCVSRGALRERSPVPDVVQIQSNLPLPSSWYRVNTGFSEY